MVEHLLQQVYGGESGDGGAARGARARAARRPRRRSRSGSAALRGARVDLRVPQRGDKRALMETVHRNAEQSLARHKVARAGDLTARSQALQELQDTLELDDAPLRIECFDISHVQGTNVVGVDGRLRGRPAAQVRVPPVHRPRHGRRAGPMRTDDTAAMHEVLTRRFRRYLDERVDATGTRHRQRRPAPTTGRLGPGPTGRRASPSRIDPDTGRPRRFAYPPNLVVVDGGLPQVNAARAALDELGIDDVAAGRAGQAARGGLAARAGATR